MAPPIEIKYAPSNIRGKIGNEIIANFSIVYRIFLITGKTGEYMG
jgi:hypothetical protein